jgi:3-hydroxybutyryl-CoA dehydrogenase
MHIVVKSNNLQQSGLASFFSNTDATITWIDGEDQIPEADIYFDHCFDTDGFAFPMISQKLIFVNAVVEYGQSIPSNCIRYNGWPGFLHDTHIEIAANNPTILNKAVLLLNSLNKKALIAPDQPGMVSARIVSMIINEAYFGFGDAISSKKDIDTAMKLGTNYPFGPFEWSELIGLKNIHALLEKLNENSVRYAIAPSMIHEL